jgi:hypothetical protein
MIPGVLCDGMGREGKVWNGADGDLYMYNMTWSTLLDLISYIARHYLI